MPHDAFVPVAGAVDADQEILHEAHPPVARAQENPDAGHPQVSQEEYHHQQPPSSDDYCPGQQTANYAILVTLWQVSPHE